MKNEKIENEKFCDTKVDARDDVEDSAKHVGDGGDIGGGEGGDDYVIGGDGVAVVHGVLPHEHACFDGMGERRKKGFQKESPRQRSHS